MLTAVRERDDDGVFSVPVVEEFPEITASYLNEIANPMDLRTIEEERVHQYEAIAQLQDDLLLMLDNCIQFNSPESDVGQYSM